jgi:hypothetical protein
MIGQKRYRIADFKKVATTFHTIFVTMPLLGVMMEALKSDYAGHEACREFFCTHRQVAIRTFANLVATVFLHAPTSVPTTSAFGYTHQRSDN